MTEPLDFLVPFAVQFLPAIGNENLEIPAAQRVGSSTATSLILGPGVYHLSVSWRGTSGITTSQRTVTTWFPGPSISFLASGETRSTDPFTMIVPPGNTGRLVIKTSVTMTQYHIDQGWAASVHVIPEELGEA